MNNDNRKKTGRPLAQIDQTSFEELCGIQCTKAEICAVLRVDEKTVTRWCKDTYGKSFHDINKKLSSNGKATLRRWQWRSAAKGNIGMQIWLGKQYLAQSDNKEHDIDGGRPEPVKIVFKTIDGTIKQNETEDRSKAD